MEVADWVVVLAPVKAAGNSSSSLQTNWVALCRLLGRPGGRVLLRSRSWGLILILLGFVDDQNQ